MRVRIEGPRDGEGKGEGQGDIIKVRRSPEVVAVRAPRVICEWGPAGGSKTAARAAGGGWDAGRVGLGAVATVPAHRCRMARRCR